MGPLSNLEKIHSFHAGHFLLNKKVKKRYTSSLVYGEQGAFLSAVVSFHSGSVGKAGLKREPH